MTLSGRVICGHGTGAACATFTTAVAREHNVEVPIEPPPEPPATPPRSPNVSAAILPSGTDRVSPAAPSPAAGE